MTDRLPAADWLAAPETDAVMAALDAACPGGARFVGGCVRNTLMGRPVDDVDIATQLHPEDVISAMVSAGIKALPTGLAHGTVTAIVNHVPFEITTLRRDVETDGRRAVVAFTEDWTEDALRRDFRLNAIYADRSGVLFDPTGGGLSDAVAGHVVFIGDADMRLREDYLRILRFFRFNAWYGAGIDAAGLMACERQKRGLAKIAAERIWKEINKLLAAPEPGPAVEAMAKSGVLGEILPEADMPESVGRIANLERAHGLTPDPLRRLMGLVDLHAGTARRLADRLRLSNVDAARLLAAESADMAGYPVDREQDIRAAFYRFGAAAVIDRAVCTAGRTGHAGGLDALVRAADTWKPLKFPVTGADFVDAGLPPGPAIGEHLRALEDWWVAGDFKAKRPQLIAELKRRLAQN
ncbi:MAG: CCA tRNA nucleotidyltransferase [Pseudomonadota bacterium]